jgi:hypothetical protein
MTLIDMIARRDFSHQGVSYVRGAAFQVEPVHASILVRLHHARLRDVNDGAMAPPPVQRVALTVEPPTAAAGSTTKSRARKTASPGRRNYSRRDIASPA